MGTLRKNVTSTGNSKYKDPEVRLGLRCIGNYKKENVKTLGRECCMKTETQEDQVTKETEIGVMHLPAKEDQGLPAPTRR